MKRKIIYIVLVLTSISAHGWEAKVKSILQHGQWLAVTFTPDPGPGACEVGSTYLIAVDGSPANNQLFSMVLAAQASDKTLIGYSNEPCSTAIWGASRPLIKRLSIRTN